MKFLVSIGKLKGAMEAIVDTVKTDGTIKELAGVYCEVKENKLTLHSTNLDSSTEVVIPVKDAKEGSFLVEANLLLGIISKISSETVEVKLEKGHLFISAEGISTKLQTLEIDNYPNIKDVEGDERIKFSIKTEELHKMFALTAVAAAVDNSRPILQCINIAFSGNGMMWAALDGFRIAVMGNKISVETSEAFNINVKKDEFGRILRKITEEDVIFSIIGKELVIKDKDDTFIKRTTLMEGDFLDYTQILPKEFQFSALTSIASLREALDLIKVLKSDSSARFIFNESQLKVEANGGVAQVAKDMTITSSGEALTTAFNPKYLDILGTINKFAENVYLQVQGPLKPMVIRPVADDIMYQYLVLPVNEGAPKQKKEDKAK